MIGRFIRKPLAVGSLTWILLLIVLSVLAPWIAPYAPDEQDITNAWQGPTPQHLLGTGQLGLDVLSRILHGGQITLMSTAISVGVYALVGMPIGLIAGYRGGLFDRMTLRVSEIAYALPAAVIILVVLAVRPNDQNAAMIALGLLGAPSLARVVRAATINVREELFIRAARTSGLRDGYILLTHMLPSVLSTVIVHVALFATAAIGMETGLGFLGVGTKQVTWGQLVAEASGSLGFHPWLLVPSGFVIISFILACGLLGDGLRDAAAEAHSGLPRPRSRGRARPELPVETSTLTAEVRGTVLADEGDTLMDPGDAILSVHGLTAEFESNGGYHRVIDNVSFSVARGEKLGVVGESGSGKSVMVTALLGLLQGTGRVLAGTARFDGIDYHLTDAQALARLRGRSIALIGQNPISALDSSFTVKYQLAEVIRANTTLRGHAVTDRVRELLESVRLPDPDRVARSYPHQLSGGMAQRVGIALALAGQPAVILADEPTTALDVTIQADVLDLLRGLDAAVVLVTHDWGVLADLCSRALVMYAGQFVEEGAVDALIAAPQHPYTSGLLRSNPHFAVPGGELPAMFGHVPAPGRRPLGCRFAGRCPVAVDACRENPVRLVLTAGRHGATRCLRPETAAVLEAHDWKTAGARLGTEGGT